MTFEQALVAIKAGEKVRRPGWTVFWDKATLQSLNGIEIRTLLADDFIIVEDPQPEPTIEELRRAVVAIAEWAKGNTPYSEMLHRIEPFVAALRRSTDQ